MSVRRLSAGDVDRDLVALTTLLIDAVESGASVGFLAPIDERAADEYWRGVQEAVERGHRILLGAFLTEALVGAVQLDLASAPNGSHRAEVLKLFVHRSARQKGIGQMLMRAVEDEARTAGRQLLVLDTRCGDSAEKLYGRMGYRSAGVIPRYARSSAGTLDDTVIMYRWLE